MKLYKCENCKNVIEEIYSCGGGPTECCGKEMTEIVPNSENADTKKHIPIVKLEGDKLMINVGEVEHPMVEMHYIPLIVVRIGEVNFRFYFGPKDKPEIEIPIGDYIGDAQTIEVAAYCNLHGLWETTFKI